MRWYSRILVPSPFEAAPADARPVRPPPLPIATVWLGILVCGWLTLVAAGLGMLMTYSFRPGDRGQPPVVWPERAGVPRDPARPTLLVFAHPKCPCTRASLDELSWIMGRCGERVACRVYFLQPSGAEPAWHRTDIWSRARSISGVVVEPDPECRIARRFGARTSGHVLLYDRAGRLRFDGGITPSRGHRGDNWGRERIVAVVSRSQRQPGGASGAGASGAGASGAGEPGAGEPARQNSTGIDTARVFGCPLFTPRQLESRPPAAGSRPTAFQGG